MERAQLLTDGRYLDVTGGCWLSTGKCVQMGQRIARLEAENGALAANPPSARWLVVAFVGGLVAGAVGAGLLVWQFSR